MNRGIIFTKDFMASVRWLASVLQKIFFIGY